MRGNCCCNYYRRIRQRGSGPGMGGRPGENARAPAVRNLWKNQLHQQLHGDNAVQLPPSSATSRRCGSRWATAPSGWCTGRNSNSLATMCPRLSPSGTMFFSFWAAPRPCTRCPPRRSPTCRPTSTLGASERGPSAVRNSAALAWAVLVNVTDASTRDRLFLLLQPPASTLIH